MYTTGFNSDSNNNLIDSAMGFAFSDPRLRASIFRMMGELDAAARRKGEPEGLRVRYAVDLGRGSVGVMRGADLPRLDDIELPPRCVEVFCRMPEEFRTDDEWLGPVLVERTLEEEPDVEPDYDLWRNVVNGELSELDALRVMILERQYNSSLAEMFPVSVLGSSSRETSHGGIRSSCLSGTVVDGHAHPSSSPIGLASIPSSLTQFASGPSP